LERAARELDGELDDLRTLGAELNLDASAVLNRVFSALVAKGQCCSL
jgi:hypothetical protein